MELDEERIDQFPLNAKQFQVHVREAIAISWYECVVMPGLLQTMEYATAVFREHVPAYDDTVIETRTAERIDRQEILHRPSPPTLSFVVWEPLLHLRIGGTEIRRAQLQHLRELTELRQLVLQILPLDAPSPFPEGLQELARPSARRTMTSTAPQWFKSSHSSDSGQACLEVALFPHAIHVRDSKNDPEDGPTLQISPAAWRAFTAAR